MAAGDGVTSGRQRPTRGGLAGLPAGAWPHLLLMRPVAARSARRRCRAPPGVADRARVSPSFSRSARSQSRAPGPL